MKETIAHLRTELNQLYPRSESEAIIRLIFEQLKGWKPVDIIINEDKPLSDFMKGKVQAIIDRLKRHEPIQYILGTAHFYGLDIKVTPDVLIPRPETAELVDLIVKQADEKSDLTVLDAGTGSGCIAIALARNLRFPQITAIDNSSAALNVAKGNAHDLRVKVKFCLTDILHIDKSDPMEDAQWDIIVSNPPYIAQKEAADMEPNVLDYEPHKALFVPDDDPLLYYRILSQYGASLLPSSDTTHLKPGGHIYFEINPIYSDKLQQMMQDSGYTDVRLHRDIHGRNRFLTATLPADK